MTKMNICEKKTKIHLVHIIKNGFDVKECHVFLALTFLIRLCWQNILELFQGNDSNPLNAKELMHKVWLDMIEFNTPTH